MNFLTQVRYLIYKEMLLEWRSKYALNSILLYVISTVFVCYQAFRSVDGVVWNALFWIILLFASINAISKSFVQESRGRQLYYYTLASQNAVIISKIIYNIVLMLVVSLIDLFGYSMMFRNSIRDAFLYFISVILGSISFSTVFNMISEISVKANKSGTRMAILSF